MPDAESACVPAHRTGSRWAELAWSFVDKWEATLPSVPAPCSIHYLIEGYRLDDTDPVYADADSSHPTPTIFGYHVDTFRTSAHIEDSVIYQIFVDRFYAGDNEWGRSLQVQDEIYGGSLRGICDQLPYLSDLGITALWLTPIFESKTYHAYDACDFETVADRIGGAPALKALVEQAHARGIAILLDLALNHCSCQHPFFLEASADPASPYRDWFTFDVWPDHYRMFFSSRYLPELNTRNPAVVRYLCDIASSYVEAFGIDGFRLDYALGPPLVFWSDLQGHLKRVWPDVYTVAEATASPGYLQIFEGRVDGCLDFPMLETFQRFFLHRSIDASAFHNLIDRNQGFYQEGFSHPMFLDNHDMNRFLWAAGGDKRKLKLAAVCQFSLLSTPVVYYGTEVGLSQEQDVSEVGDGAARLPMIWDRCQDTDLLDFYRILIKARREHPSLRRGNRHAHIASGGLYAYECFTDGDRLLVILNNCDEQQSLDLPEVHGTDLLTNTDIRGRIYLEAFQAAIIA